MTPTPTRIIIVGAGQAAGDAATQLRANGFAGTVTVVGDEPYLPYLRPPLSKTFLAGDVTADSLLAKSSAAYEKSNVTVAPPCATKNRPA